jgi:hypothetical protein
LHPDVKRCEADTLAHQPARPEAFAHRTWERPCSPPSFLGSLPYHRITYGIYGTLKTSSARTGWRNMKFFKKSPFPRWFTSSRGNSSVVPS